VKGHNLLTKLVRMLQGLTAFGSKKICKEFPPETVDQERMLLVLQARRMLECHRLV
jgi:hypothetical protein